MLQELKEILGIIKDLPHMVMWVLAGLLLYKITIIGSVYGVIKFAIDKFHDYLTKEKVIINIWKLDTLHLIDDAKLALSDFLHGKLGKSHGYIHSSDVREFMRIYELGKATDEKNKLEQKNRVSTAFVNN